MTQCHISNQIDGHLAREDAAMSEQEAKQEWIEDKANDALETLKSDGWIWLGDYYQYGEKKGSKWMREPQELAFEADEEAVNKILEAATLKMLRGEILEAGEEMENLKPYIMKALIEHFSKQVDEHFNNLSDNH